MTRLHTLDSVCRVKCIVVLVGLNAVNCIDKQLPKCKVHISFVCYCTTKNNEIKLTSNVERPNDSHCLIHVVILIIKLNITIS